MDVHKIISDGGGVWLPFAVSRLKALRATGLPYASQSFTMPDGMVVRVEVTGRQNYIRISGGPSTAYMESGQLSWSFPGELNPTKHDPAKWHFLDVGTDEPYLGNIKNPSKEALSGSDADGEQKNYPLLTEEMESQAIGYIKTPRTAGDTPTQTSDADAKDLRAKEAGGDETVMKKMVPAFFPPSLFSGKMRLFMQAQYGARWATGKYPFELELVGTSVILRYLRKGLKLQFGFWSHSTTGLYTSPDGKFYVIVFQSISSGLTDVYAHPLVHGRDVKGLVKRYRAGVFTGDEKTKVEAYILASSTIDLTTKQTIGTMTVPDGSAMAYGWKFNTDGDQARVVLNALTGSGTTAKFTSNTVTVNFTYAEGVISMAHSTVLNGDWIDGWGTYNIFVPVNEITTAPLEHFSVTSGLPRPEFNFPITEIYGYYKDNAWVPVKLSRTVLTGPFPIRTQFTSGILFENPAYANAWLSYQYGYMPADGSCTWDGHEAYSGTAMDLTIGGATTKGIQHSGTHYYFSKTVTPGGTFPNAVAFTANQVGSGAYVSIPPPGFVPGTPGGDVVSANVITEFTTVYGTEFKAWTLVIPGGDCEAAFDATESHVDPSSVTKATMTDGRGITRFTGPGWNFVPWTDCYEGNGWYGAYGPARTDTYSPAATPPPAVTKIYCSNAALSNVEGSPPASYSQLFSVDYTYPYYDRGMYSYVSYGKRYIVSEGLPASPTSVNRDRRFVGWV